MAWSTSTCAEARPARASASSSAASTASSRGATSRASESEEISASASPAWRAMSAAWRSAGTRASPVARVARRSGHLQLLADRGDLGVAPLQRLQRLAVLGQRLQHRLPGGDGAGTVGQLDVADPGRLAQPLQPLLAAGSAAAAS